MQPGLPRRFRAWKRCPQGRETSGHAQWRRRDYRDRCSARRGPSKAIVIGFNSARTESGGARGTRKRRHPALYHYLRCLGHIKAAMEGSSVCPRLEGARLWVVPKFARSSRSRRQVFGSPVATSSMAPFYSCQRRSKSDLDHVAWYMKGKSDHCAGLRMTSARMQQGYGVRHYHRET